MEISKKELRQLLFWANYGVQKAKGGSYIQIIETIKKYKKLINFKKVNNTIFGYYIYEPEDE